MGRVEGEGVVSRWCDRRGGSKGRWEREEGVEERVRCGVVEDIRGEHFGSAKAAFSDEYHIMVCRKECFVLIRRFQNSSTPQIGKDPYNTSLGQELGALQF